MKVETHVLNYFKRHVTYLRCQKSCNWIRDYFSAWSPGTDVVTAADTGYDLSIRFAYQLTERLSELGR